MYIYPMTSIIDPTINTRDIVESINTKYGPVEKIILFGSHARGNADEYSDVDLIIIKKTTQGFVDRLISVPRLPIHADIFVYTPEEFEMMKENENPFIMNALQNAQILYEKF